MAFGVVQALRVNNPVLCPHMRRWEAKGRAQDVLKEFARPDVNDFAMAMLTR